MRKFQAFLLVFCCKKLFPAREKSVKNSGQLLLCLRFGGGPLLDAIKKKKKERNTSLALHVFCAFGSLFFHLSSFQGGEKRRDLIPILFPKRERERERKERKERKEREKSIGEKSNNGEKDEGRQTATAAAKDD